MSERSTNAAPASQEERAASNPPELLVGRGRSPSLQAAARKRVPVSSRLVGSLGVSIGGLLCLLLGGQGVDLLAGPEQAAVVLLLNLGADVVERHEGRGALEVVVNVGAAAARGARDRVGVGRGARQGGGADEDAAAQLVKLGQAGLLGGPVAAHGRRALLLLLLLLLRRLRLRSRGLVGEIGSDNGDVGVDDGGSGLGFLLVISQYMRLRRSDSDPGPPATAGRRHSMPNWACREEDKHTYRCAQVAQIGEDLGKLQTLHGVWVFGEDIQACVEVAEARLAEKGALPARQSSRSNGR